MLASAGIFFDCSHAIAEQERVIPDPCDGLLAILDRPTVSDSACVVPSGRIVFEIGYQHAILKGLDGKADNYPEAELRVGLPGRSEFVLLPSNYNSQRMHPVAGTGTDQISGASAVTLGLKHELGYDRHWLGAVDALFTLPSGGAAFGSKGLGAAFSGIVSYSINEQVSLALQLGLSSQTTPSAGGGDRFTSFISNFVATWQPLERLQFFGEVFGQSSTGPGEGAGYNADGGIQYLLAPFWEIDAEGGARLSGELGGLNHYFGIGMGFTF